MALPTISHPWVTNKHQVPRAPSIQRAPLRLAPAQLPATAKEWRQPLSRRWQPILRADEGTAAASPDTSISVPMWSHPVSFSTVGRQGRTMVRKRSRTCREREIAARLREAGTQDHIPIKEWTTIVSLRKRYGRAHFDVCSRKFAECVNSSFPALFGLGSLRVPLQGAEYL